jgi:predicted CoA-binding protein
MSPKSSRPSHQIGLDLLRRGFSVIPVHPTAGQVVGLRAYTSVDAIPPDVRVDIVDVAVSRDHAGPIADQAAKIGAKVIWFQPGAENPEAECRAQELGLEVVSRRCIMADHDRLLG